MRGEKKMSELLKTNKFILILIAGILFTSSNSMLLVNAQPTPTSLIIFVPSPIQGKECTIVATLKDENGNPLPNMDIDFYVCGTKRGTAKTNSTGVAFLKYTPFEASLTPPPRTETYGANAVFKGTTTYMGDNFPLFHDHPQVLIVVLIKELWILIHVPFPETDVG